MHKEIETLVEVKSGIDKLEDYLSREFEFDETVNFKDTYFFDPLRPDFQEHRGNSSGSLRIRNIDGQIKVTAKKDNYDEGGKWLYSDEIETTMGDEEKAHQFFAALGLQKYTSLEITSDFFTNDVFEIAVQKVTNLGTFVEVEYIGATEHMSNDEVKKIKKDIDTLLATFPAELTEEIDAGKLKLMLIKEGKI